MATIADFHCTFDNSAGICPEVAAAAGVSFPDAYLQRDSMIKLSLALKAHEGVDFCKLPFCHTLEGEAMGGQINPGNERFCPRAGTPVCQTMEDLLALPEIDFTSGRIAETLDACRALRAQGENVALMLSGPFSILNVLMDATVLFRLLRREPERMRQVFDHIRTQLLKFTEQAVQAGVNIISYADSTGGVNIIGPKNMAWMVDVFTVPLLRSMQELTQDQAMILLCPKQSFALIGTERARWLELPAGSDEPYVEACCKAAKAGYLFGENCINNTAYRVSGKIRALEWTE